MPNSTTISGFDQMAQTYYNEIAQDRLVANFVHYNFCNHQKVPLNAGQTFQSYQFKNIAAQTNPIAEDSLTANQVQMSAVVNSVLMQVYGGFVTLSSFAIFTERTSLMDATVDVLADAASDTVDQLIRNNFTANATVRYTGGKTSAQLLSTDIMTTSELRSLFKLFRSNKVKPFRDGQKYVYVCSPLQAGDLISDDTVGGFAATNQYQNAKQVFQNELGSLAGFRIVDTPNTASTAVNGITCYQSLAIGENANTTVDLNAGNPIQIIAKEPGSGGTSDPMNNIATVAFKLPGFAVLWYGFDGPRAYVETTPANS